MADKQISQLVAATTLNNEDLLVIQQGQVAKKLSGEALALFVYSAAGSMIDEVNSAVEEAQAAVDELLEEKNTIAQTIADMAQLGTDTTLTTPAMAADAKAVGDRIADVEKDALAGLNQKTISDVAIASFDDGADDAPVKELIVNIDPVQDLHGQDAPYPAGGGKNKFDQETLSNFSNYTNLVSSYYYTEKIQLKPNTNYYIYPTDDTALSSGYYVLYIVQGNDPDEISMTNASVIYPVYGGIIGNTQANRVFTTKETGIIRFGVASSAMLESIMTKTWQLAEQQGDYDPYVTPFTYSPYSNICPITGWAGCRVTRTGKSLAPSAYRYNVTNYIIDPIFLQEGIYTFSYERETPATWFYVRRGDTVNLSETAFLEGNATSRYITFTIAEADFYYVQIYRSGSSTSWDDAPITATQLELGSTVTDYEPHSSTTLSVTFPDSAGTVYGGTVGLVSGVLTVDRAKIVLNGTQEIFVSNWRATSTSVGWIYRYSITNNKIYSRDQDVPNILCDTLETASYGSCYYGTVDNAVTTQNGVTPSGGICIRVSDTSLTNNTAINNYLSANPIEIVYELATPITYQLTPVEVRTLLKINNIWANTGNINTLIYRTIPITEEVVREIMGDYEEIIAGVESTGKATKNYYAGDLVIVNDILYKCLVNVASGETFTSGAGGNVSQTTIADELATLQALYDNLGNLALLSYTTA